MELNLVLLKKNDLVLSKKYDCIFLDRDGTINIDTGYISKLQDFEFFKYAIEALGILKKITDNFIIITNQSGVSRGLILEEDLIGINNFIYSRFSKNNLDLLDIYYCIQRCGILVSDDTKVALMQQRCPGPHPFCSCGRVVRFAYAHGECSLRHARQALHRAIESEPREGGCTPPSYVYRGEEAMPRSVVAQILGRRQPFE